MVQVDSGAHPPCRVGPPVSYPESTAGAEWERAQVLPCLLLELNGSVPRCYPAFRLEAASVVVVPSSEVISVIQLSLQSTRYDR
jgi:hypothetical protein